MKTMTTMTNVCLSLVLVAALGACSKNAGNATPNLIIAVQARGDVVPRQIYPRPVANVGGERVQIAMPASPRDPVALPEAPFRASTRDSLTLLPAGQPGTYDVLVDSSDGATMFIVVRATVSDAEYLAALRTVRVYSPDGELVNQRPAKNATSAQEELVAVAAINLAGKPVGAYTIEVDAEAAALGLAIEVQQPHSKVSLQVQAGAAQHLAGDDATATILVADDGHGLGGVQVSATLVGPDARSRAVALTEAKPGEYTAVLSLDETAPVGMYEIRVEASGLSADGFAFTRATTTSIHHAVPTARIVKAEPARAILNDNGLVEAWEVDVKVESASRDRYEVSATLAGQGPDGTLRRIGEAQTADVLEEGTHTLTLRFEAGVVKLGKLEGTLSVRNLQLYSQGTDSLYHREGFGMGVVTAPVKLVQLAPLREITPAVQEMIDQGAFTLQ